MREASEYRGPGASSMRAALVQRGILTQQRLEMALRLAEVRRVDLLDILRQEGWVADAALEDLAREYQGTPVVPVRDAVVAEAEEEATSSGTYTSEPGDQGEGAAAMAALEETAAPFGMPTPEPRDQVQGVVSSPTGAGPGDWGQSAWARTSWALPPADNAADEKVLQPLVTCRAEAENADGQEATATIRVLPTLRTRLEVTCVASPAEVREDEETAMVITVTITNKGRVAAAQPQFRLSDLPEWFEVETIIRTDTSETLDQGDRITVGNLDPGASVTVAVHGTARPKSA